MDVRRVAYPNGAVERMTETCGRSVISHLHPSRGTDLLASQPWAGWSDGETFVVRGGRGGGAVAAIRPFWLERVRETGLAEGRGKQNM